MPVGSYADLAATILRMPPGAGVTRVVAVDGPAGSGKSVFASRLAAATSAAVICLDDLRCNSYDLPSPYPHRTS